MDLPNLRLFLCDGAALDLREYEVYASREAAWGSGRLRFYVIGASSIVVAERGGMLLAEVIACLDREPAAMLLSLPFHPEAGAPARAAAMRAGYLYTASLSASTFHPSPPAVSDRCLEHRFPGPGSPRTRIHWDFDEEALVIRTWHDYPEADLTVRSVSTWAPGRVAPGKPPYSGALAG